MGQQVINVGAAANDGTGEPLRDGLEKAKANFAELYGAVGEILTADRDYYVRPDGNDANDGLTDAAGGSFLTIQKAIDTVQGLNLNNDQDIQVTIHVGDAIYAEALKCGNLRNPPQNEDTTAYPHSADRKCVAIIGNEANPENVVISPGAAGAPIIAEGLHSQWRFSGIKTNPTVAGAITRNSITARNGAYIVIRHVHDNNEIGNGQFLSALHAEIRVMDDANIVIEGSRSRLVFATYFSHIFFRPDTLTLIGNPSCSIGWFQASDNSFTEVVLQRGMDSLTGTGTGRMLVAEYNSHVTCGWKLTVGDPTQNFCDGSSTLSDGFIHAGSTRWEEAPTEESRSIPYNTGGIWKNTTDGTVRYYYNDAGTLYWVDLQPGGVIIPPTSDPHVDGALWNNAGVPAISAG